MAHFHHVVLFQLKDGVDVDATIEVLNSAKPSSGLVAWDVERSIDERKGPVIAEVAVFESADTFVAWRDSAFHREAAAHLRTVADWLVADWEA